MFMVLRRVHIKFLCNSKFDFTANSLVTNTVVIVKVLCIYLLSHVLSFSVIYCLHMAELPRHGGATCFYVPDKNG